MALLKFNKSELVNLSYSLKREIILANRTGAYCNTSIVSCNTRRYHGLLAVPVDGFGGGVHLLLSSLDESLTIAGHQFNLGIHNYDNVYEPRGHKYIVDFNADVAPTITYKVGDVLLSKTYIMSQETDQVMIKYQVLESPSKILFTLKPFLAFRSVNALTRKNGDVDTRCHQVDGGVSFRMYPGYPDLNMQLSCEAPFKYQPYWYDGITYSDEYRRGFDCKEDLWVPGTFSLEVKAGDSFVFSASVDEIDPKQLKRKFNSQYSKLDHVTTNHELLVRNAELLKCNRNGKLQINAGFSWLYTGLLRETLVSLPGLTLFATGDCSEFEEILDNLIADEQERLFHRTTQVEAPLRVTDVLQQYIAFAGDEARVWKKYGETLKGIIESYGPGRRNEITLHPNGLLWAQMYRTALSWMNAYIDGNPVTERAGYQVDTNAWWYNALCFAIEMESKYESPESEFVQKWTPVRDLVKANFQKTFLIPSTGYLSDYVDNAGQKFEVRPNMLFAVYIPYQLLDDEVKLSVMRTIKYELLTKRGIRTLSPRNIAYKGVYEGSQMERDLAYHQGCTRTELLAPYIECRFRMSGPSCLKRAEFLVEGFYEDISKHGVGCFSELYDGDPPHEPHGAISSACATASLLKCEYLININKTRRW